MPSLPDLLAAATPRPWRWRGEGMNRMIVSEPTQVIVADPVWFNPQDEPLVLAAVNLAEAHAAVAEALIGEGHGEAGGLHNGDHTLAATCPGCIALARLAEAEKEQGA